MIFCIVTVTVRDLLLYFCVKLSRYSSLLKEARDFGIKKGLMTGLGIGFFQLVIYGSYALAFWYVWGLFYLFFLYKCFPTYVYPFFRVTYYLKYERIYLSTLH